MNIVVAGHICLDITPKFSMNISYKEISSVFIPGKLINVDKAIISTGGAVPNTGLALSKLGAEVSLIGKIGDDLFGKGIVNVLKKSADMSGMSIVKGENSSYTVVIAVPGTDRIFLHYPGTNNTFGYDDVNFEIVKKAKLFHLGYPSLMKRLYSDNGAELIRIFKQVKSLGITTSLDMSLPDPNSEYGKVNWLSILNKLLPYVDIFLPSFEEIAYMLARKKYDSLKKRAGKNDINDYFTAGDLSELSSLILEYGCRIVVLKCSHRGIYARTAGKGFSDNIGKTKPGDTSNWSSRELWAPSYHIEKIASATGSGDSAIAGFLMAFQKGETIEGAVNTANAVGAQSLSAYDAAGGIGNWADIQKMVKDKKAKFNQLRVDTLGWQWNKEIRMWIGPNDRTS